MRSSRVAESVQAKGRPGDGTPSAKPTVPKDRTRDVDPAFGARIRAARMQAGMSLAVLGQAIGVTHQQMQKYEAGRDRITVGAVQAIAEVLGIHPGTFFDDLPTPSVTVCNTRQAMRVAGNFQKIVSSKVRSRLAALVAEAAEQDDFEV